MSGQHRATPEHWEQCAAAHAERISRLEEGYDELAARIDALETAQRATCRPLEIETTPTTEPRPDGLVEQVARIGSSDCSCILELCARVEALEQRLDPPMAEAAADDAPASEPPPLDVPQSRASDWINRHGTFRPTPAGAERTGTDWGMVIAEAARWGQRQGWFARAAAESVAKRQATQRDAAMNELRAASAEARPAVGGLVERVADAIYRNGTGDGFREEARAAREVAGWLQCTGRLLHAAELLELEAYAELLELEADR